MILSALRRLFHAHPASIGESYGQHLGHATGAGMRLVGAGLACLIHALLPFLFVDTASRTIRGLHEGLSARHLARGTTLSGRSPPPGAPRAGSAARRV